MTSEDKYLLNIFIKAIISSLENTSTDYPYHKDDDIVYFLRWKCSLNDKQIKELLNALKKLDLKDTLLLSREKLGNELIKNKTESYDDMLKQRTLGYRLLFGTNIVIRDDECSLFNSIKDKEEMKKYISKSVKEGMMNYLEEHFKIGE